MEANKMYEDVVYLIFNVFKNEKSRTMLKVDPEFEAKILELINDVLLLEKDFNAKLDGNVWFAEFGKALVNILQVKAKFEKVDNKKVDEVYADYSSAMVYITKELELKRKEFEVLTVKPDPADLKFYQKVTSVMIEQYQKKAEPKVEVVDDDKVKAKTDFSANTAAGGAGFSGANNSGPTGPTPNPGAFAPGMGNMRNPFLDDRFFPYKSKLKHITAHKIVLSIFILLSIVMVFVVTILKTMVYTNVYFKDIFNFAGSDSIRINNETTAGADLGDYGITMSNNWGAFGFVGGFNNMTFYSGIIMNLIYLGISVYVCYSLLRPVRTYRQTFVVPTSLLIFSLFILLLGVAWSAYSDKDVYSKMNIEDIYNWLKSSDNKFFTPASYDVLKDDTVNIFEKNHDAIVNYLNQIFDSNLGAKQNAAIVAFSVFLGVGAGAFVSLIVTWSMNPKMDREKVMKLQTEIQLQMQYAMQGQKYDIDKSLFVPEAEYNAVMNKINEKLNKRRSN
jgi:hypothetical protein